MKAFKIKNSEGKFSTGGINPRWTTRGKTWGTFAGLKLHLRQHCSSASMKDGKFVRVWINNIPESWVVVELSEEGIKEYSARELYKETEK